MKFPFNMQVSANFIRNRQCMDWDQFCLNALNSSSGDCWQNGLLGLKVDSTNESTISSDSTRLGRCPDDVISRDATLSPVLVAINRVVFADIAEPIRPRERLFCSTPLCCHLQFVASNNIAPLRSSTGRITTYLRPEN